jgi:short-subunit dehydrogenase
MTMTMTAATERPLAIVTGASSGIGYGLAKQFASSLSEPGFADND